MKSVKGIIIRTLLKTTFNKITRSKHLQFSNLKAPFAYPFGHLPNLELKEKWKKKKNHALGFKTFLHFLDANKKNVKTITFYYYHLWHNVHNNGTAIVMHTYLQRHTCGCM
jgi:hypothetical protein